MTLTTRRPGYSFVIPIHDERETLRELFTRLRAVMDQLDADSEVVLVDDGSTDGSYELMREVHADDQRFGVIRLSRNFGHQIAITAGLDHARGDAVVIMDADLQDPPEVVPEMARRWRDGYSVVYGVQVSREGERLLKRLTAKVFYRLLGRLTDVPVPVDSGDFRLIDRNAVEAVQSMREHNRYLRGMFAWVGFDQTGVHYERAARFAGSTKYSWRRMINFAVDGVLSFSSAPLRVALNLGFAISTLSFLVGFVAIACRISNLYTAPGWASITVVVAFLGGVQLTVLGIMGEYIARIYDEVRRRPLYLVRDQLGLDAPDLDRVPGGLTAADSTAPTPVAR